MQPLPNLDEELQAKVLAFVTEPRASTTCVAWKAHLYQSLHLESHARFNNRLGNTGSVVYSYNAVRPLAEDFEESVSYNFAFAPDGTYRMQWARTFDAWSSQSEQHIGVWHLYLSLMYCETVSPGESSNDREVRYAPPGYLFQIPIRDILEANGTYFQAPLGSPTAPWELPARTGRQEDESMSPKIASMWQTLDVVQTVAAPQIEMRPNTRFVDIDGEMHEVSGDIVENWPEHEWARLMRCRLRFGING